MPTPCDVSGEASAFIAFFFGVGIFTFGLAFTYTLHRLIVGDKPERRREG